MSPHSRFRERGASSAEYIGAIVIAAVLVGAIVFTISPQGANVRAAVCDAVGSILQTDPSCGSGGEGDERAAPTDEDFQPPACQVSQTGEEYNSAVSIAFIDIGDNAGLVRTVMSDGTIVLTATDGGTVGASGGLGADFSAGGGAELGASVDFGGGVTLDVGDSWSFSGENAEAEAESFEELLDDHRTREKLKRYGGQGVWTADLIDPLDPLPEPDSTTTGVGAEGIVAGDIGVESPSGSAPAMGVDGFAGSIAGDAKWTQTRKTNGTKSDSDDSWTYTVDMSINPDVSSDIWQADVGLGETHGMSMSITHNVDGHITEIAIVTTSEGAINGGVTLDGGGIEGTGSSARGAEGSFLTSSEATTATVTTTTLALDPDAPGYTDDVAVVEDWLGGTGYEWPGVIPMSAVNPAVEGDDPFSELMHEQATVSAITSEGVTSTSGFAAEVAVGFKLGFDFSISESEAEAVYATYLGAPESGERTMTSYDDCIQ